jgi:integrase
MVGDLTFRIELNSNAKQDGTHSVFIRITQIKEMRRISTNIFVKKGEYNSKAKWGNWIRTTNPYYKTLNNQIADKINEYREKYSTLQKDGLSPTVDEFISLLKNTKSESFLKFYENEITHYLRSGKYRSSEKHRFIRNKLKEYVETKLLKQDLTFDELNVTFLKDYALYLTESLTNHPNTVYTDFKNIRTIFNNAIREGITTRAKYPFYNFKLHEQTTYKEKLNVDEVAKIETLKLPKDSYGWHVKNFWLFSYYCAGIRFGDICTLKWSHISQDNRLRYIMSKNNKEVSLRLVNPASVIIEYYKSGENKESDYIFPILAEGKNYDEISVLKREISSNNIMINRELKLLALAAGIKKKLTFHVSRHSYSLNAFEITKNIKFVQESLKHSNLKETQNYLTELGVSSIDAGLETMFGEIK